MNCVNCGGRITSDGCTCTSADLLKKLERSNDDWVNERAELKRMTFDKAFERLTKMAGERRCSLRYSRRQSGEFGIMSESVCSIGEGDDFIITRDHGTFDGALVEMAALLADYQDAPEIEG